MLWIKKLFRRIEYPKLGRWALIRDTKIINRKVDLANEDHCGCCDEETNKKNENKKNKYNRPF